MYIIEDSRQQKGKHETKHKDFADMGVNLLTNVLPYGDYAYPPKVSVDTKRNMEEIAQNIGGAASEHQRFKNECVKAKECGAQLIILVENELGITDLSQVHTWQNPRVIYSPNCVQGDRLQRAMTTIQERYGVKFLFCSPQDSAKVITELLEGYT
jgi:ribosome-associated protein